MGHSFLNCNLTVFWKLLFLLAYTPFYSVFHLFIIVYSFRYFKYWETYGANTIVLQSSTNILVKLTKLNKISFTDNVSQFSSKNMLFGWLAGYLTSIPSIWRISSKYLNFLRPQILSHLTACGEKMHLQDCNYFQNFQKFSSKSYLSWISSKFSYVIKWYFSFLYITFDILNHSNL